MDVISSHLRLGLVLMTILTICRGVLNFTEREAQKWFDDYEKNSQEYKNNYVTANWNYQTNMTTHNQQLWTAASIAKDQYYLEAGINASRFQWKKFDNITLKRAFAKIVIVGIGRLPKEKQHAYHSVHAEMTKTYSTGKVCGLNGNESECMSLDPGLTRLFESSRDPDMLSRAWKGWRDNTGKRMREDYTKFVALKHESAKLNGFDDVKHQWQSKYEVDDLDKDVDKLWEQILPLYKHIHAYTRRKLREIYPDVEFKNGQIPAHLLGNMWAQSWGRMSSVLNPFKNVTTIDVTQALVEQGYNTSSMVELADSFFVSLGLDPLPDSFWKNSMLSKPQNRDVVCHASAWDFYNGQDFRIKQCTDITLPWLMTTHHEMGHIQYYQAYKHQPSVFRRGANPGFHEAVGDLMALSVSTPEHLHKIGLLKTLPQDPDAELNYLMSQALDKVVFLPFALMLDQWRWSVFSGKTTPDNYNEHWWKNRCRYQGVFPPVPRSEEDFDPGAKYHVPNDTPYIRYFVSFILQFQLHKSLCDTAGVTGPLHRCDIYQSKEAGEKLQEMLSLGSSVTWPEALEVLTGSQIMSAEPLLEYFKPLHEWLIQENAGEDLGWDEDCPAGLLISNASSTSELAEMATYLVFVLTLICSGYVY